MPPVLAVEGLRVAYGGREVVHGVDFELRRGEIFGIVGESGSGKSTIAKVLAGLHPASSGRIVFDGLGEMKGRLPPQKLQLVFQDAVGSLDPRMTVRQTLAETLAQRRRLVRSSDSPVPEPSDLLARVGLSEAVLGQYPREMSGGQCQRVSVARALALEPDVLIADEPVSALDVSVQARVLNLLRDLRRELGLSILLIAHDLAVVKNVCDRIAVMEKGRFVDCGDAERVFSAPESDYTRRLLTAVPRI